VSGGLYLGADPGLTGAIAAVDAQGRVHLLEDLPTITRGNGKVKRELDPAGLAHLLRPLAGEIRLAVVEQVGSMPGQGVASVFSLGHTSGVIAGVISTLGIPLQLIGPATWKKTFGLTRDKTMSRTVASRLYPDVSLHRVKDHNLAEALLLAHYAKGTL
jgi:crossover junction endodeoxyribonuclease RuvC